MKCMIFIWIVGWLYTCGCHARDRHVVVQKGSEEDKKKVLDCNIVLAYAILFFLWPHYLGYK